MQIPKVIFQTWKSTKIPEHFVSFVESWSILNPSFKAELWTDEMNGEFIANHYPTFLPIYESYRYDIQRIDAIRYFLLYHFGGIYIDLDIECIKPIIPLIEQLSCFFALENFQHNSFHNQDYIASNALMGCTAGHPFMEKIIEDLYTYKSVEESKNNAVLNTTGPMMVNRVLAAYSGNDVILLDPEKVSPLSYKEAERYIQTKDVSLKSKIDNAYCVHYHWGTWWKDIFNDEIGIETIPKGNETTIISEKEIYIEPSERVTLINRRSLHLHDKITPSITELIESPLKNIYFIYDTFGEGRRGINAIFNLVNNLPIIKKEFHIISDFNDYDFPFGSHIILSKSDFLQILNNEYLVSWSTINYNERSYRHPKLKHFPIGIDYHTLLNHSANGEPMQSMVEQEKNIIQLRAGGVHISQRRRKAFFCVNNNNSNFQKARGMIAFDRYEFRNAVSDNLSVDVLLNDIPRSELWKKFLEYAFVIAPTGNGMDTHRIWECLYLGCIAITQSTGIDRLYDGLPVVIINDPAEITEENLIKWYSMYHHLCDHPMVTERYQLDYWINNL